MRHAKWLLPLITAAMSNGCSHTDFATQLVQIDRVRSTQAYFFLPAPEELIRQGRIQAHRQTNVGEVVYDTWILKARGQTGPGKATVLVLHSYKMSKADFPFFGIAERLAKLGYDVILPDLRAHGRTTGKYFTYGVRERSDLSAVLDDCIANCGLSKDVYVFGSMVSGMVAIEYAASDKRCRGLIVDSPAMDFGSVVRLSMPMAPDQDYYGVLTEAASTAEFDPAQASAVIFAGKLSCPMLVMYGVIDAFTIPAQHVQAVFQAAAGPKKLEMPAMQFFQDMFQKGLLVEDYLANKIDDAVAGRIPELLVPVTRPAESSPASKPAQIRTTTRTAGTMPATIEVKE